MVNALGKLEELLAGLKESPQEWLKDAEGRDYVEIETPWYATRYPVMNCPCPPPTATAEPYEIMVKNRVGMVRGVHEPATLLWLYREDGRVVHLACQRVVGYKTF